MRDLTGIGRLVQAEIYKRGATQGRKPVVPVRADRLEEAARRSMSDTAWSYVGCSAGSERTARANVEAFDRWRIVPRVLRDVSSRDLGVELFGHRYPSPFLLAPIGALETVRKEAELAAAPAAREFGMPFVISSQGCAPMEETAKVAGTVWYQLYWSNEDAVAESFVRRAEAIGAQALVVTLDTTYLGWRTTDLDHAYLPFARGEGIAQYTSDPAFLELAKERAKTLGDEPTPKPTPAAVKTLLAISRNFPGDLPGNLRSTLPRAAVQTFLEVFSRPTLTWTDLAWLRSRTDLPIVLKGVQHPADAVLAVEHGVDGIIVSNHGGRQVDGAIASLDALPPIADEVAGRIPVLFDSGIRTGSDAVKALALGASAVLLGRPWVYGLALAGQAGVEAVLEHVLAEFDLTLALAGVGSVAELGRDLLAPVPSTP